MIRQTHDSADIRPAAVAGQFYPDDPQTLREMLHRYLQQGETQLHQHNDIAADTPTKALIAPHAGYVYSGPVAGTAYAATLSQREQIKQVVLIGPCHRTPFSGLATVSVAALQTPFGPLPVDRENRDRLLELDFVHTNDHAHASEHSLEAHLPFIHETFGSDTRITPLLFSDTHRRQVRKALQTIWGGDETLIVVSSDLSHFHTYDEAQTIDRATVDAITTGEVSRISPQQACGSTAIAGLLDAAVTHSLTPHLLDLRNSGDTAGPRQQVVGYTAMAFTK